MLSCLLTASIFDALAAALPAGAGAYVYLYALSVCALCACVGERERTKMQNERTETISIYHNPAGPGGSPAPFLYPRRTRRSRTASGRSVMRAAAEGKGAPAVSGSKPTALNAADRTSTPSIIAKDAPIQTRGPAPKGAYAPLGPRTPRTGPHRRPPGPKDEGLAACSSGSHRSGQNSWGRSQADGARWRSQGETSRVVPGGSVKRLSCPKPSTPDAAQRPTMYAGGSRRRASRRTASK